jgi:hypothetical protein
MHWSDRYVGLPYVEGEFDCADLARTVLAEVFGRDIRLPSERWYAGETGCGKVRAMAAQIDALKTDYAAPTAAPTEGDGVLLIARARMCHIGLYCVIANEPWVLHAASHARQVVRTRVRELERLGYRVEGYYRWT